MKIITDDSGIVYEEVDYKTYLHSKNKHRIVKSLEAQYFVEIEPKKRTKERPFKINELVRWKDNSGEFKGNLGLARVVKYEGEFVVVNWLVERPYKTVDEWYPDRFEIEEE